MRQKVLAIDDSPMIHTLLVARLKDEPIELHSAGSGAEGLAKAAALLPDLILLDVEMPNPDGFEVCRQLKADEKLLNVPVIFLTGASSSGEKIRGLELGAVDYITKPFDPAELKARVRAALRMKFMIDLLAQKAQIDALTGLWNRRYFDSRLEQEISMSRRVHRPISVLMLDIDHFKKVNDTYGHSAGDEVIRRVGQTLAESVRLEDVVCRYGGEEFAIIAPGVASGAVELAERLCAKIESVKFSFSGRELTVTVSIGVAGSNEAVERVMVEQADGALYRAKQMGRNRVEAAHSQGAVL